MEKLTHRAVLYSRFTQDFPPLTPGQIRPFDMVVPISMLSKPLLHSEYLMNIKHFHQFILA
jgi:hypothetical protein